MLENKKRLFKKILLIGLVVILPVIARLSGCGSLTELYYYIQLDVAKRPFDIPLNVNTLKVCIIGGCAYLFIGYALISNMKNIRTDEEYGSAKFGDPNRLNRKYRCRKGVNGAKARDCNVVFTACVKMGLDLYRHARNLNTLIFGGSGAGKTRGFVLPNILLGNCSFVVTDPKGEILAKIGWFLKLIGYKIKVLDLKNHFKSNGYNPFKYFHGDDDILKFVNQTWEAMSDKTAAKGEQIWDDQAKNMFISFIMYLFHYAPKEEQNFAMIMTMIKELELSEDEKNTVSVIDVLFDSIDHNSATYGYYRGWSAAKGRTLASIVTTLTAKLTVFNLDSLKQLTMYDELDFTSLITEKTALFCVISDTDKSYNFLCGTMYSQLIKTLNDYADNIAHGPLPRHVRFIMDEFANVALPDDYEKILATARSRNMSFAIILQNKQQIEAIYEKYYKALIGNCDEILFLGSPELETCKYVSEELDKETVYVRTYNVTLGLKGQTTRTETKTGRDLMTAGELRTMPNDKAILLIRGEHPVIDYKINLKNCKNYKYLWDGEGTEGKMYDWGSCENRIGTMQLINPSYGGVISNLPDTDGKLIA